MSMLCRIRGTTRAATRWRATTFLCLAAALTALLVGSAAEVLLSGVLAATLAARAVARRGPAGVAVAVAAGKAAARGVVGVGVPASGP